MNLRGGKIVVLRPLSSALLTGRWQKRGSGSRGFQKLQLFATQNDVFPIIRPHDRPNTLKGRKQKSVSSKTYLKARLIASPFFDPLNFVYLTTMGIYFNETCGFNPYHHLRPTCRQAAENIFLLAASILS